MPIRCVVMLSIAAGAVSAAEPPQTPHVELPPVVVSATRTEKPLDQTPVRVEVVDRTELERTHARTLKEALQNVPGLQLQEIHGKSGYQLSMQGLTSDQVLVLIDGLPISPSTGSTVDLSQYALAAVERIEVVKGATSAQYGSAAMGGVINVITRRVERGAGVSARLSAGSYGKQNPDGSGTDAAQRHAQLSVEGGGPTLRARLAGDFIDDDGFAVDPDRWTRQGDAARRQQYAARVEWQALSSTLLWLEGNRYREDDHSRYEFYAPPNRIPQHKNEDIARNRFAAGGIWHGEGGWRAELKGVSERYDGRTQQFSNDVRTSLRDAQLGLDHASAQLDLPAWRRQLWSLGADYQRETLRQRANGVSEILGDGAVLRSSRELFVQNDVLFDDTWELLLGLRAQDDSDFGDHLAPKLGVRAHLLRGQAWDGVLRAAAGQGYRVPNLKERHFLFDHSAIGYRVIGNPDLQPETSDSWQLGGALTWRRQLTLELNLFRNDVEDLIQTDLDNATVVNGVASYSYENVAEAMTQGAEISARWTPLATLGFDAAYTYTDTEDRSGGGELTRRPRHIARLGANLGLRTGTEISLRGRHQSSELIDTARAARSPGWTTVDLKLNQSFGSRLGLFGGIDNLFDRQRDFSDADDFGPLAGRFIYLGMRYAWTAS